ncbi:hypothetical protein ABZ470_36830 [Streptosporangium sp. NPDC020072]|uniref:hypothetical protein n=1 Tax=unclassified Streptosporangium TaxID=2632669 RepID=UPI00342E8367
MTGSFYRAHWRGSPYRASPELRGDGLWLRLWSPYAVEGAEEVVAGRWIVVVPAGECERIDLVTTVCEWRGEPFLVVGEREDEVLLEYPGGLAPVALSLGFERVERGVYRRWTPRAETGNAREEARSVTIS